MLNRFYEQELSNLRDLAVEFSRANPALAPMLSGPASDPDVERLLEGVAFLTGLIRQKLDDEFPEFIQELVNLILPHYPRPIPSTTIVAFSPRGKLTEPAPVATGVELASVPVDGTSCVFRTCYPVEVLPLELTDARFVDVPGKAPTVRLDFTLQGMDLAQWQSKSLRLFLAGLYPEASKLLLLLTRYVSRVAVTSGTSGFVLGPESVKPVGFADDESLIPYPSHAFPGYRLIQEYFIQPEKFLFVDIDNLSAISRFAGQNRFSIEFSFKDVPDWIPDIRPESFVLFATPVVNLFSADADPVVVDHRRHEYRVEPAGAEKSHFQIYEVEQVIGYRQGVVEQRTYSPLGLFRYGDTDAVYQVKRRPAHIGKGLDYFLTLPYREKARFEEETLSIRLTCTNRNLPESLRLGDICKATDTSPDRLSFRNIRPLTPNILPPLGGDLLWRLISHMTVNYLYLSSGENLRALLHLYIFTERSERGQDVANRRRVDGVDTVTVKSTNRLVSGVLTRGSDIAIRVRQENFAGPGDLNLFGLVLDNFLGCYASINSYTRLSLEEAVSGERLQWPERLGQQLLL